MLDSIGREVLIIECRNLLERRLSASFCNMYQAPTPSSIHQETEMRPFHCLPPGWHPLSSMRTCRTSTILIHPTPNPTNNITPTALTTPPSTHYPPLSHSPPPPSVLSAAPLPSTPVPPRTPAHTASRTGVRSCTQSIAPCP